mgnify:CR=1 FL=1
MTAAERIAIITAIDDEEEPTDEMPQEMMAKIREIVLAGDKDALSEAFRITVRLTKAGIKERMKERGLI